MNTFGGSLFSLTQAKAGPQAFSGILQERPKHMGAEACEATKAQPWASMFTCRVGHRFSGQQQIISQGNKEQGHCRQNSLAWLLREDSRAQHAGQSPLDPQPHCRRHSSAASWAGGPTAPGPRPQSLAHAPHGRVWRHWLANWKPPESQPVGTSPAGSLFTSEASFWKRVWCSSSLVSQHTRTCPPSYRHRCPTQEECSLCVMTASL